MPALAFLALAFLALWYLGEGNGAETDEGVSDPGSLLDALGAAVSGGVHQAEAWAKGVSLGLIQLLDIGGGRYLREDAGLSFVRLKVLADTQGVQLVVDSAFRSMEEQTLLWTQKAQGLLTQLVARPGWSNHQNGIALDIAVQSSRSSPTYVWLSQNAPAFGWTNVGASYSKPEYWHWEYNPENDEYA